ncbi:MAG: DUF6029 family protein [Vicingaceae bacterium]
MKQVVLTILLLILIMAAVKAQDESEKSFIQRGEVHGNFQAEAQYYLEDSLIGAPIVPEKLGMNGFGNVNYTNGPISAGFRYESYQNALQGFPIGYRGNGIPYRYFTYNNDQLSFTLGHFYEQFGNGLVLRTYEERGLGYDNVLDGIRVLFRPAAGVVLKGVIGQQRIFFDQGEGIVRGIDGEFSLNEMIASLSESKHRITIGASFVSKYQADQRTELILPENVGTGGLRVNYKINKVRIGGEYVYKMNDPSLDNGYRYKSGETIFLQGSYSRKGFGLNMSAMRVDNMSFKSDRDQDGNNLLINYLPALTRQQTYNLLATLYPYATQLNGQVGAQIDLIKKFNRKTTLGGKYGTTIAFNLSAYNNLDTVSVSDPQREELGLLPEYTSDYGSVGEVFWREANVEITKKFSKKVSSILNYSYIEYNQNVIEGKSNPWNLIYASIFVADITYRFNQKHALRTELQGLITEEDKGSWATALLEYTYAPHWFLAVMDQYNYGNKKEIERIHYFNVSTGYNNAGTRVMLSYGRQRAGIFCVGGVCRFVPASNGFYMSITHSF